MISTPAARISGPPIPKIATSRRCLRAIARRAAYMSPEASPAERRSGMGGMWEAQKSVAGGEHGGFRRAAGVEWKRRFRHLVLQMGQAVGESPLREEPLNSARL